MIVHTSAGSANGNTVTTVSTPINTSGANVLIVFSAGGGILESDITDSAANSWSGTNQGGASASGIGLAVYVKASPVTSATHSISITHTGSNPSVIFMALNGYTAFDGFVGAAADVSLTSIQPNLWTPGAPNEMVITGVLHLSATSGVAINGGFTITDVVTASATKTGAAIAYLIQTGSPTSQPTWSWTTASTATALQLGLIGTFTPSAPAGRSFLLPRTPLTTIGVGYGIKTIFDLKRNPTRSRRRLFTGGDDR